MTRINMFISDKQFVLDCINKEFDIIGSDIKFNTFEELANFTKEHPKWFSEYKFISEDQYERWKLYYIHHFYKWKPRSFCSKEVIEKLYFPWFSLSYGFSEKWE